MERGAQESDTPDPKSLVNHPIPAGAQVHVFQLATLPPACTIDVRKSKVDDLWKTGQT